LTISKGIVMNEQQSPTLTSRLPIRARRPRVALLAGIVACAVALPAGVAATTPGRVADTGPTSSAVGPPAGRPAPGALGGHSAGKDKKSVTVRMKVGQTLSLATLTAIEPSTGGTPPSPGKQDDWSLVESPADTGLTAPPPGAATFKPDVPGTYVFQSKPGKGNGAAAAQRTLNLQVEPNEELVCVNTRVRPAGDSNAAPAMTVGGQTFAGAANALHVVVLERATTGSPGPDGPTENNTFAETDQGYAAYKAFLTDSKLTNAYLVLVSGSVTPASKQAVWGPLGRLGAVDVTVPDGGLEFSFIGIPGISKGSAWQTTDPNDDHVTTPSCGGAGLAADPATNLSGWLTLDTTGVSYTYVSPDFVDFDTDPSPPGRTHAIEVGNQTYTAVRDSGSFDYFHVLVLDRRRICDEATSATECETGPALVNHMYAVDCGTTGREMNDGLSPWSSNPDVLLFLVWVPGTGTGCPTDENEDDLITTLRAFGASPTAPGRIWALDPKGGYALVGGGMNGGLPDGTARPIVAESFVLPDYAGGPQSAYGTGRIAGTLVRDHQNRFGPREASLTGDQLDTLGEVVYGPTSPWLEAGDPAGEAAFAYLSERLGYPVDPQQHPQGVREQYLVWTSADSVPDPATRLQPGWCTTDRPPDVDAAACAAVLHELRNEFLEVRYVDEFLARLQKAYVEVEGDHAGHDVITGVEDDITKQLTPPPAKTSLASPLVHSVLSVAEAIPEVGEVFEVAGAVLDYAESQSTGEDGGSADPVQAVYDTGDKLLEAADTAFGKAVAQIDAYQPLIVSDYAKLTLVGHRAATDRFGDGTDLPETPWAITDPDLARARTGLEQALKQWLYPPLVDAGFPVWLITIPSSEGSNPADRTPVTYRCAHAFEDTHPFGAEPENGWIRLSNGSRDFYLALGGTRYDALDLETGGHHAPVPDADLLAQMFGPLPDGVGLNRTWYFEHFFERQLDTGSPLAIDCP
jgi:hypothetical protein